MWRAIRLFNSLPKFIRCTTSCSVYGFKHCRSSMCARIQQQPGQWRLYQMEDTSWWPSCQLDATELPEVTRMIYIPTTPACAWWNRPEEDNSSGKLESTHPSRTRCRVSHASTLTRYSSELLLPRHQGLWMIWQRTWSWQTTTSNQKT